MREFLFITLIRVINYITLNINKMGRKTTNPVSKLFFDYNHQKDESTCTVQGCRKPLMKGRHSHNLETHIRSFHSHEAKILDQAKEYTKNNKVQNIKRPSDDSTVQLSSKVINTY